jgi:hypothetical protein
VGFAAAAIAVILSAIYLVQGGYLFPVYEGFLGILETVQGYLISGFQHVSNYFS